MLYFRACVEIMLSRFNSAIERASVLSLWVNALSVFYAFRSDVHCLVWLCIASPVSNHDTFPGSPGCAFVPLRLGFTPFFT